MVDDDELARSFGRAAGVYEQGRPDYPAEAVAWLLAPVREHGRAPRVADVGAGTGKLTRALVAASADVVAVDPDPDMLGALTRASPGIPALVGTAERLPLADGAMDAVVLGQAWHWVEPVAGSAEAARVVRPGGVLGAVWNVRDDAVPWVRRLTAIMRGSNAERMLAAGDPPLAAPFTGWEGETWRWSRAVTRETLVAMVRSRSYVITAPEGERARIDAEVAGLLDEVGAVGERTVELPYVTHAYRAVRP